MTLRGLILAAALSVASASCTAPSAAGNIVAAPAALLITFSYFETGLPSKRTFSRMKLTIESREAPG